MMRIDQHMSIGATLYELNRWLVEDACERKPKTGNKAKRAAKAIKLLTHLRSVLEDIYSEDYPKTFTTKTYYPGT